MLPLVAVVVIACEGRSSDIVCRAAECTEEQWEEVFVRAVTELHGEGVDMPADSVGEGEYHDRLVDRMLRLTGAPAQLTAPRAIRALRGSMTEGTPAAARHVYDDHHPYCGADWRVINPGPCMNSVCFSHDWCYDDIANFGGPICRWSEQTAECDRRFFEGYGACLAKPQACGFECNLVASVAAGYADMCSNPQLRALFHVQCARRATECVSCEPTSAAGMCADRVSNCGALDDSCGGAQTCGTCAPGQTCRPTVDENDQTSRCQGCPGSPACSGHGTCDAASWTCTCAAGWTGADCGTSTTCQLGQVQSEACGNCGTRTRTCAAGVWGAWSACAGQGVCMAGQTEACGAGGMRTCGPACAWGACGGQACTGPDQQSCGLCGTQARTCDMGTGQWSAWGACNGQGVCSPGSVQSCGVGGQQTCSAACGWGACSGGGCGDGVCAAAEDPISCTADCAPIAMAPERLGRVTQGTCASTTIGWHPTNGSPYWTFATACPLPNVFTPDVYDHERMRWRWQIRKAGQYRLVVKIPSSGEACSFALANYTTGAQYYVVRPSAGPFGSLHTVDQRANAGTEATIAAALNTNLGELALYLYDSVADIAPPCCDCVTSKRVFFDYARVDWLGP